MRTAMPAEQATAEVEALLHRLFENDQDTTTNIYLWWGNDLSKAPSCVGVRVAEISMVTQKPGSICGSSFMANEPDALGIIAAVERCIIERMACTCDEETWDQEVTDADWRLEWLIRQSASKHEEAGDTLTRADHEAINNLRRRGFAVVVMTPNDLQGVNAETIEGHLVERGLAVIDNMKD